jgi:hypothetical protein
MSMIAAPAIMMIVEVSMDLLSATGGSAFG